MSVNPDYICTPVDGSVKENQMMISLNQNKFNNAVMVCKTVKIFIECDNLCCMMLESMGGRYIKFLLLGYISSVIQNSGSCLNSSLCRNTCPKGGFSLRK